MIRSVLLLPSIFPLLLWAGGGPGARELCPADSQGDPRSDSIRTAPMYSIIEYLPLWLSPENYDGGIRPDTLTFDLVPSSPGHTALARGQRWLGLGMIAVCGSLSYIVHNQADQAYQVYLHSGDLSELDGLFRRAEQLDRLSGWLYMGTEGGILMVALSFFIEP